MSDDKSILNAKKRVKKKKKFYQHLTVFIMVNLFLFMLNLMTSEEWWFQWATLGWGMAVGIQYFDTFGFPGTDYNDPAWEESEIEKELNKSQPDFEEQLSEEYLDIDEEKDLV